MGAGQRGAGGPPEYGRKEEWRGGHANAGRPLLVAGGSAGHTYQASAELLAADGSG